MTIKSLTVRTAAGDSISAAELVAAMKHHSVATGTKEEVIFRMVGNGNLVPIQVGDGRVQLGKSVAGITHDDDERF